MKQSVWNGLVVLALLLLLSLTWVCVERGESEKGVAPLEPAQVVRIGLTMQPSNALTMVALAKGYFQQQGITPVIKQYPSGRRALMDGLFTGEVDITTSADVPVAMAGLLGRDIRILATTFSADNVNRVVARRDAQIEKPSDLAGKHIATQRASAVHFYLDLFLHQHGLEQANIQQSFMKAEQLPLALARGDIDAFSMREPYVSQAKTLLKNQVVVFAEPGLYPQVELLLIQPALQTESPALLDRYLRALLQAEAFALAEPKKAIYITADYLGVDEARIAQIWPSFELNIALDKSTPQLLAQEARWLITHNYSAAKEIPNYKAFIVSEFLEAIKPSAVSVK